MAVPPHPPGQPRSVAPQADRMQASVRVSLPATLLMVVGGLGSVWNLLALALNLLGAGFGTLAPAATDERLRSLFSGGFGIAAALVGMAVSAAIVFGAMRMKALGSYEFAVVASILALLPCCPCCFLSLPAGIWALVVLLDGNVKAAFRGQ